MTQFRVISMQAEVVAVVSVCMYAQVTRNKQAIKSNHESN